MFSKAITSLHVGDYILSVPGRPDVSGAVTGINRFLDEAANMERVTCINRKKDRTPGYVAAAREYDNCMTIAAAPSVVVSLGYKTVTLPASTIVTVASGEAVRAAA
jgi:hypothetical protein